MNDLLNGTFDNQATQQRESWVDGKCVAGVHAREIAASSGSTKYLHPFGYYPDLPTPQDTGKRARIMDALAVWYGDGANFPDERQIKMCLAQEDSPIDTIAQALEYSRPEHDRAAFLAVVEPVIKYLAENHHPHATIVIDSTSAQLSYGEMAHHTEEFLRD